MFAVDALYVSNSLCDMRKMSYKRSFENCDVSMKRCTIFTYKCANKVWKETYDDKRQYREQT